MTAEDDGLVDGTIDPKRGAFRHTVGLDGTCTTAGLAWFEWTFTKPGRPIRISVKPVSAFIVKVKVGATAVQPMPGDTGWVSFGPATMPKGTTLRIEVRSSPGAAVRGELELEYLVN